MTYAQLLQQQKRIRYTPEDFCRNSRKNYNEEACSVFTKILEAKKIGFIKKYTKKYNSEKYATLVEKSDKYCSWHSSNNPIDSPERCNILEKLTKKKRKITLEKLIGYSPNKLKNYRDKACENLTMCLLAKEAYNAKFDRKIEFYKQSKNELRKVYNACYKKLDKINEKYQNNYVKNTKERNKVLETFKCSSARTAAYSYGYSWFSESMK